MAAVRTAPAEEDTDPTEETALEKAVAALTILSKKRWQSGHSRVVANQGAARGAAGAVARARSLTVRGMRGTERMPGTVTTPRLLLGRKQVGQGAWQRLPLPMANLAT